jgi:uncharacterized protein YkwD
MSKHLRRATFRSSSTGVPLTAPMSGLLIGIGILTVVLPISLGALSGAGDALALAPRWAQEFLPGPILQQTPTASPTPPPPPSGDATGPRSGVDDDADEADDAGAQNPPQAAPRDTAPPATKIPSAAKPAPPAADAPAAATPEPQAPAPSPVGGCGDVLGCVNQLRAANGIPPLSANGALTAFAENCVGRLASTGVFEYSYNGPAGFGLWREHIAAGYWSASSVVDAWMSSSWHAAALLDPAYTQMGIAVADGPGGPWWCQELGG